MSIQPEDPRTPLPELVSHLQAGHVAALDEVYRTYSRRLYAYALGFVSDPSTASDVVSESLLLAFDRISQLREPSKLQAWLYAITRSVALRSLRTTSRTAELTAGDEMAHDSDLGRDLQATDATVLVQDAMATLNPPDREVLTLAIQHELSPTQMAEVMGTPVNGMTARLSRARSQLEKAVMAVMFVRQDGAHCPELAELVRSWRTGSGPLMSPLTRKRVVKHTQECEVCEDERTRLPLAIPALAATPLAAPSDLFAGGLDDAWAELIAQPDALRGAAAQASAEAPPFGADGFPSQPSEAKTPPKLLAALVGAAALLAALAGIGIVSQLTSTQSDLPTPTGTPAEFIAPPSKPLPPLASAKAPAPKKPLAVAPAPGDATPAAATDKSGAPNTLADPTDGDGAQQSNEGLPVADPAPVPAPAIPPAPTPPPAPQPPPAPAPPPAPPAPGSGGSLPLTGPTNPTPG